MVIVTFSTASYHASKSLFNPMLTLANMLAGQLNFIKGLYYITV